MYSMSFWMLSFSLFLLIVLNSHTPILTSVPYSTDYLPLLGLGTAGLGLDTHSIVKKSLEMGVKLIDTAQAAEWYSEEGVGQGIREYEIEHGESNVVLVTKIHPRSFEFDQMAQILRKSFIALRQKTIDCVLLHAPYCWSGHCTAEEESISWKIAWRNLQTHAKMYNIKEIGVSNFHPHQLMELIDIGYSFTDGSSVLPSQPSPVSSTHLYKNITVIQNWMDPFHQDREVRTIAKQFGIQYMAYSSFGTQWGSSSGNVVRDSPVLQEIASKHRATVNQVVLNWLVMHEGVIVIPRAFRDDYLRENFQSFDSKLLSGWRKNESMPTDLMNRIQLDQGDIERIRGLDGTLGEL